MKHKITNLLALTLLSIGLTSVSQANQTDWSYVCKALGQVNQCENVSVCTSIVQASCQAKPHAVGTKYGKSCNNPGLNEMGCGWLAHACEWRAKRNCVPSY